AQVQRSRQHTHDFSGATVDAQDHFRPTPQPTGFGAQGDRAGGAGPKGGGSDAVAAIVPARAGAEVQTLAACISDIFDGGKVMRTLEDPARSSRFKPGIGD